MHTANNSYLVSLYQKNWDVSFIYSAYWLHIQSKICPCYFLGVDIVLCYIKCNFFNLIFFSTANWGMEKYNRIFQHFFQHKIVPGQRRITELKECTKLDEIQACKITHDRHLQAFFPGILPWPGKLMYMFPCFSCWTKSARNLQLHVGLLHT